MTTKHCPKCNNKHTKPGTFCSRSCANGRRQTAESNEKRRISNALAITKKSEEELEQTKAKRLKTRYANKPKVIYRCKCCDKEIGNNKYQMCQPCFFESPEHDQVLGHYSKYKRQRVVDSFGQEVLLLSSLEIRFFDYLTKNQIRWAKPKPLRYNDGTKNRIYKPDFLLVDTSTFIEVKGFMWNNDEQKMKFVLEQHKDKNIKILFVKDLEEIGA